MHGPNSFQIVGCGKVAQTLARLWQRSGRWRLQAVWSRQAASAQALLCHGAGQWCADLARLPGAAVTVIGVKDDAIATVAAALAEAAWLSPAHTVLHFSGTLGSDVLAQGLRGRAAVGSLHPVFAFADADSAVVALPGHHAAIEGDVAALPVLHDLAESAGLRPFVLAAAAKARYHAGLSAAANFLVTLHDYACGLIAGAGLPENTARALVQQLMRQNLDQLASMPAITALTGPIVRGDIATVAAHWHSLAAHERPLYQALARQTAALAAPRLHDDARRALAACLATEAK